MFKQIIPAGATRNTGTHEELCEENIYMLMLQLKKG